MNAQEQALLDDLLTKLGTAAQQLPPSSLDPEAEARIQAAVRAEPHLAYLLTQRHLLLEQALHAAQARIRQLEQAAPTSAGGSFLGAAAAPSAAAQTNAWGQPMGRAPMVPEPTPAPIMAAQNASRSSFGGGSFLGTAAATATGVLGGALLFQGIEHLMGGGYGGGFGGGMAQAPVEDITNVTENFYGSDPSSTDLSGSDLSADQGSGWQTADYNDPSINPMDDSSMGDSSGFDTASNFSDSSDSGGGFFDGLFGGGGGDDDWV